MITRESAITVDGHAVPYYQAAPETDEPRPAIIVIHEVWGLNDNIRDIARRYAAEGYSAYAPDLLIGTDLINALTPDFLADLRDQERRVHRQVELRTLMAPIRTPEFAAEVMVKLRGLFNHILQQAEVTVVGVTGFCFGGTYSYGLAVAEPLSAAAAPFYGNNTASQEQVNQIKAPILAFYGEEDHNLMEQLPDIEAKMAAAGVDFERVVYPGAGHAFFNDTNKIVYREDAAADAWRRVLDFFASHLHTR